MSGKNGAIEGNYTLKNYIKSGVLFVVCIVLTLICLVPIYVMIVNATRNEFDIAKEVSFWFDKYLGDNMDKLATAPEFKDFDAFIGFKNSAIISIGATFLSVFFSAFTAYGLYVYDFKLRGPGYAFILLVMMVPMQVTSAGFLSFMIDLGLADSFIPLILPTIAAPAIVFFMRQYLQSSFPKDIVEAARIDGCGEFRTFIQIAIPMMKPAIAVQAIFAFVANWNNFYQPSMILISRKHEQLTMPMMVNLLTSNDKIADFGVIYYALSLSILPLIIAYILLSKFIVEGVSLGGVKEY